MALAFLHDELPDGHARVEQIITIKQEPVACTGHQPCNTQNMITFTVDGLEDDSTSAYRYILILEQASDQPWHIVKQDSVWACWQGRGHTDFSSEPCI